MPHLHWVEIHAGINHLPFAFLLVVPVFEIAAIIFHKREWRVVSFWLLVASVIALVPTLITGWITGNAVGFTGGKASPPALFLDHRLYAFIAAGLAAILLVWRVVARDQLRGVAYGASIALALVIAGVVGIVGFWGGRMVLGSGQETAYVPIKSVSPQKLAKIPNMDPQLVAAGENLFMNELPCLSCHMMEGKGGKNGPDLTHEAQRHNDPEWQIKHLKDPSILNKDTPMPSFDYLSPQELKELAAYLVTRK